jgi:acyl carrier protein
MTMDKQQLDSFIKSEISKLTNLSMDEINTNDRIAEIGLSSLMLVELNFSLKEKFDIELPFFNFTEETTFQELMHMLYQELEQQKSDIA